MVSQIQCPPIRPGQLTMGYAAELAGRFRCSSVYEFCADFEINFRNLARGDANELKAFAVLTNNPVEHLRRFSTIHHSDGTVQLGNALLTGHVMSRSTIRVCPDCVARDIRENPDLSPDIAVVWRRNWVVGCIDTCYEHARPLVEVAHINGYQFQWDATLAWSDLSLNLDALLASPIRRRPHKLQEYAIARIEGSGTSENLLDRLPLHQAISACAKFGSVSMNIDRHWRELDEPTRHQAYREGFEVLAAGASGISSLLTRRLAVAEAATPMNLIGPNTLLKQVHLFLRKNASDPAFDELRDLVADAVFDVLPIGPEDEPVLGRHCTQRRTYSMMAASRQFGLNHRTFALYAEAAGVAVRTPMGNLRIDAPLADAFFGESGGLINLSNAGKEIGALRPSLDAFVEAGLLTPLSTAESRKREHQPVRRKDVEVLLSRFMDKAITIRQSPKGAVALTNLWRHIRSSYVEVHRLILDGEIWLGSLVGPKPYAGLYVNLEETRKRLSNETLSPPSEPAVGGHESEFLDLPEAATIAGVNRETVRQLASDNAIQSVVVTNPTTGNRKRMFIAENIAQFATDYISLTQAAREMKLQPRHLRKFLDEQAIPTAFDEKYGARLYRREDLLVAGISV